MPTALVTGASRGIGKPIAVHLARAGFDVALTARTVHEGERREHSSTLRRSDTSALPGSLSATAELVEAAGVRTLTVPADLTDRASMVAAAETVLAEWGRVDVLVNNGRYIGPGHMDRFEDTPLELLDLHLQADVMAPLALIKAVLPGMLERGSGCIVNITSGAGYHDPPAAAGDGGWGLSYGFSKGALHRVAGILQLELAGRGVGVFNVQPGFVATERMVQDMGPLGFDASLGAPPDVVGAMDEGEVRSAAVLLLIAGYDTTAKTLSNALVAFEMHPDERALLVENPGLLPSAVEEVMRWRSIVQAIPRKAMADVVLADTDIPAGDVVYAMVAAANRDPARWADADRFRVGRPHQPHLGFGYGPHLCLGAPLARLEARVALERLLRLAPGYRLRDIDFGPSFFVRGPERGVIDISVAV